jgi:hypothetical protein
MKNKSHRLEIAEGLIKINEKKINLDFKRRRKVQRNLAKKHTGENLAPRRHLKSRVALVRYEL